LSDPSKILGSGGGSRTRGARLMRPS